MIVSLSIVESIVLYCICFSFSALVLKIETRSKLLKLVLASVFPFIISGFRYNVGWDYGSYVLGFELFDPNTTVIEIFKNYQFGASIGLDLVMLLTKSLNSSFLFFAVTSMLCFLPVFLHLLNEWDDEKNIIPLAAFVACFTLLFTEFSAIKQGIAIGFCLYSLGYVYKRKLLRFIVCVGVAFMFHSTAIIFFPIYFFWGYGHAIEWWKKVGIIALAMIFVVYIGDILQRFGGERFSDYGTELVITNNNLFYVMLLMMIVYLIFRQRLIQFDKRNELLIILYVISVIFMLLGFQNAFTKRIAYYFNVVEIMLLPQLIFVFSERSRRIVQLLIGLYVIIMCILLNTGTADNMAPIPYSFLFGELQ